MFKKFLTVIDIQCPMLLSNDSQIHCTISGTIFAASGCLFKNVGLFDRVTIFEVFEVSEPTVSFGTDSGCCFVLFNFLEKQEDFCVRKTA